MNTAAAAATAPPPPHSVSDFWTEATRRYGTEENIVFLCPPVSSDTAPSFVFLSPLAILQGMPRELTQNRIQKIWIPTKDDKPACRRGESTTYWFLCVFNPLVFFQRKVRPTARRFIIVFFFLTTQPFFSTLQPTATGFLAYSLRCVYSNVYIFIIPLTIILFYLRFKLGHVCVLLSHTVSRTCLI